MPELAEVEYFRSRWNPGLGRKVVAIELDAKKRVFRGTDAALVKAALTGATLRHSEARGKQMLFHFSGGNWLGIHLGMTGKLSAESADYVATKHDHLVLRQKQASLVFTDSRMFGRVRFDQGRTAPGWWTSIGPALDAKAFTLEELRRRLAGRKIPLKAALLDQKLFPGVGNWMADEILWQSRLHPAVRCPDLTAPQTRKLHERVQTICRIALKTIGRNWGEPPDDWLIHVRWKRSGHCPRHGTALDHATIAGRTTAWCPLCQPKR